MTQISILCILVALSFARSSSHKRCFSQKNVNMRTGRYMKTPWSRVVAALSQDLKVRQRWEQQTCSSFKLQTSAEYNNRSLSPWRYRIDEREDRIPYQIAVAECLCGGCIINQHEDMSYNSVPVFVTVRILRKTVCPDDPQQYLIKADSITIPVACTCVSPRSI